MDPDRDWKGGVLKPVQVEGVAVQHLPTQSFWRSVVVGRVLASLVAIAGALALAWTIAQRVR